MALYNYGPKTVGKARLLQVYSYDGWDGDGCVLVCGAAWLNGDGCVLVCGAQRHACLYTSVKVIGADNLEPYFTQRPQSGLLLNNNDGPLNNNDGPSNSSDGPLNNNDGRPGRNHAWFRACGLETINPFGPLSIMVVCGACGRPYDTAMIHGSSSKCLGTQAEPQIDKPIPAHRHRPANPPWC